LLLAAHTPFAAIISKLLLLPPRLLLLPPLLPLMITMLLWPQVLQHFEAITPAQRDEVVHKKWAVPQRHSTICAPDPVGSERQTTMSVGFLLHDSADQYTGFVLRVCFVLSSMR